ncbi:hypothetical protein ET445_06315 [Agromyces protaetiae]|uniref:Uncharacterized protein n=1 Tax=Agromyces protaetiae TaxID=2509455 RepID=A0A4P6FDF4_9MICO|nr:hypothetical protein [Agromyces protaetiae]QAY73013.1 hypothetical protein ET445_06315 [Agromyces protaetiae]
MNARLLAALPAVVAIGVLAGCGLTEGGDIGKAGAVVRLGSTSVCSAPDYIKERAPEGLCDDEIDADDVVDDDLSPLNPDPR